MANAWGADYFISIHCNYNVSPAVNGSEVYVYQEPSIAWTLAQSVLENMVRTAGTRDNLVRVNASLYVLRRTSMPAILVELAYLSNPSDAQKLRDDPFSFAYGIYLGILQFIVGQGGEKKKKKAGDVPCILFMVTRTGFEPVNACVKGM